jgi:argininosuccinate lyase
MSRLWDKSAGSSEQSEAQRQLDAFTVGEDPVTDLAFAAVDIRGSLAWIAAQQRAGLLSAEDAQALSAGLATIAADIDAGAFTIPHALEDVHTAVEVLLTERIGAVAGKLHTGRSRNDQVLTDLRLWMKARVVEGRAATLKLVDALLSFAKAHPEPLTGYTHLQRAMPSSYALWAGGYAGALLDVVVLYDAAFDLADRSPLGSAAGYGSPLPMGSTAGRAALAADLGFSRAEEPVTASQLSRGVVESSVLGAFAASAHLIGRLAWDVSLYTSAEFALLSLDDALTTGSSIMPQKRNPDVAELLRGQVHRVRAAQREIEDLTVLPGGYHRDLQHTKAPLLRGVNVGLQTLRIAALLVQGLHPRVQALDAELFATSEAFSRAQRSGRPFREVYREVGQQVKAGTFRPTERPGAPAPDLEALSKRAAAVRAAGRNA